MRFRFSFDPPSRGLMTPLGMGSAPSWIDVSGDVVTVRMGWGFRSVVPRSAITSVQRRDGSVLSRGVHGWRGRWLVNGSARGLVTIVIDPPVRGWVIGCPVRLRELTVSAEEPAALVDALASS